MMQGPRPLAVSQRTWLKPSETTSQLPWSPASGITWHISARKPFETQSVLSQAHLPSSPLLLLQGMLEGLLRAPVLLFAVPAASYREELPWAGRGLGAAGRGN